LPRIRTRPRVLPARLRNDAGIIGAASFAADQQLRRARSGEKSVSQIAPTGAGHMEPKEEPEPVRLHAL